MKASLYQTKQSAKKQLYRTISPLTSHLYTDEDWSGVRSIEAALAEEPVAKIAVTELPKCPRCWNHREAAVGTSHEDVCPRCAEVLDEIGWVPSGTEGR